MPKQIVLRTLTAEEEVEVRCLARSCKQPKRMVQRARIIEALLDDPSLPAAQAGIQAGFTGSRPGVQWVRRFNEAGLAGLKDCERPGRPPSHSQETRSTLIDMARQNPCDLGYSFELWTLKRLQRAFKERQGIHLSDSTIWTWMMAEGFRWSKEENWSHEPE